MFIIIRRARMQTILVCDDDKQIVEAIDIYLTGEGFQVIKAYDGYEALEYLEGNQVDLLIVDVMMPGLDGIRTTLKVRENSSIPIIIPVSYTHLTLPTIA